MSQPDLSQLEMNVRYLAGDNTALPENLKLMVILSVRDSRTGVRTQVQFINQGIPLIPPYPL